MSRAKPRPADHDIAIRLLSVRDLRAFAKEGIFGADQKVLSPSLREIVTDWLSGQRGHVLAAIVPGGKPVCWAKFSPNRLESAVWHYGNLFTLPDYRRRGLAQRVMGRAERFACDSGARHVVCLVDPENTPSVRFHEGLGFRPTGITRTAVGLDASHASEAPSVTAGSLPEPEVSGTFEDVLAPRLSVNDPALEAFLLSNLKPGRPLAPWKSSIQRAVRLVIAQRWTLYGRLEPGSCVFFCPAVADWESARPAIAEYLRRWLATPPRRTCTVFHADGAGLPLPGPTKSLKVYALNLNRR